jgi:hypothetical protein
VRPEIQLGREVVGNCGHRVTKSPANSPPHAITHVTTGYRSYHGYRFLVQHMGALSCPPVSSESTGVAIIIRAVKKNTREEDGSREWVFTGFALGIATGATCPAVVFMSLIFGVVYPLFKPGNAVPIPLSVWYGTWILTLLMNGAMYVWLRRKYPVFATISMVIAALQSLPFCFFTWFGYDFGI